MMATNTTAAAAATATAVRAPSQAGIFEKMNPTTYNSADPLVLFIIQATIVIALTRLLYWPLNKIREPRVIAEVVAGIILGPSVMGRVPGFTAAIFPPTGMAPFRLAANIGLILFLFLVGLEIDLGYLLRNWRVALSVAALDMCIPFGLGIAVAYGLYKEFADEPGVAPISFAVFALFIGIAIAITAFPVLCRILTSLKLLNTTVGVIVLTSGIANDVVGWVLLALCVTLVNSGAGITALYVLLVSVGFALFLAFLVRPAFMWILRRTHSLENGPTEGVVALTIMLVLAASFFTSVIGVHSIFGAFMVGLMCPHEGGFAIKLTEKIEDLTATLFVPLFFALSGINTNLSTLDSGIVWAYVVCVTVVAFFSKLLGGTIGARMNGLVWRESLTIGTLMSCKGLVELIVLNIGLQAKILSTRTFTMFVVMALVTTFLTSPIVMWLYPPWYQQKLELWKQGKIDWDGNPIMPPDGEDVEEKYRQRDTATRLLVYLRTDGLSSILSIVSLFTTTGQTPAPITSTTTTTTEPSTTQNTEKSPAPSPDQMTQPPLHIQGYRLLELTERPSSVMKVSDMEADRAGAAHDPIVKAFGTSTANHTTRDVFVSGQIAVVPQDSFADALVTQASKIGSDLIVVPWSETGSVSEGGSGFYFGGTAKGELFENREFGGLVRQVFDKARHLTGVAVYVDKSVLERGSGSGAGDGAETRSVGVSRQLTRDATGVSLAETQDLGAAKFYSGEGHGRKVVRVLYAGGDDGLFAVRLGFQLAQNEKVALEVVVEGGVGSDLEFLAVNVVISETLGDRVTIIQATDTAASVQALLQPAMDTASVLVIMGRAATIEAHSPSTSAAESSRTDNKVLGQMASQLAAELKAGAGDKAKVSLLVVQAKKAVQADEGKPALRRKASTYSQESTHHA